LTLYRSGQGGNVYQGQRVGDLSDPTNQAIAGLANNAAAFSNPALHSLMTQPTGAARHLAPMASGGMVGQNAAFDSALQQGLDNAATTINSHMSGAGRYDSGAHNQILAQNLGQIAAGQKAAQYNRDVQNMLTANAQIDNANQGQLTTAGNYLARAAEASARALGGGLILDNNKQAILDAQHQAWQESEQAPWHRLALLQAAANGFAGPYGTQTIQSDTRTRQNPGILGAVGGIGRLAGKGG